MAPPIPNPLPTTYWVKPGRFLAGDNPGGNDDRQTRTRLHRLLAAGVTFFLDLTEVGERRSKSYAHLLKEEASNWGHPLEYHQASISDLDVPTPEVMTRILDMIDTALDAGQVVYVHCFAGLGRTGLRRRGLGTTQRRFRHPGHRRDSGCFQGPPGPASDPPSRSGRRRGPGNRLPPRSDRRHARRLGGRRCIQRHVPLRQRSLL